MPASIRVGLLDADESVRFGRKLLFDSFPLAEVVFESDGAALDLELVEQALIDVLVIDQKLASGPGIDFYQRLRELTGIKQAPPAILTTSFDQSALSLAALGAGISNVLAIEQGAKVMVEAISQARSGANFYSLVELRKMLESQPRIRAVDLTFVSLVDQLPEKFASNLRRLKSTWQKMDAARLEGYDLNSLKELVARLPVANAVELVLALNRSGLLDD